MEEKTKKELLVLVVIFILLAGSTAAIQRSRNQQQHKATPNLSLNEKEICKYEVTIESTHILFSTNYELFIDDELKESWSMSAGASKTFTYELEKKKIEFKSVKIKVVSKGGGFGEESDERTLILTSSNTAKTTLRA